MISRALKLRDVQLCRRKGLTDLGDRPTASLRVIPHVGTSRDRAKSLQHNNAFFKTFRSVSIHAPARGATRKGRPFDSRGRLGLWMPFKMPINPLVEPVDAAAQILP